jgi:hypothetical protein
MVALFVGVTLTVTIFGTGLCPERYFGSALMLLFPFAGLAAVALWRSAKTRWAKVGAAALAAAALAHVAYFDWLIWRYGYGLPGPCATCPVDETRLALEFREWWRLGILERDEKIYMESNEDNFSNYTIRAFSDHPLNFDVRWAPQVARELGTLPGFMRGNGYRVAVLCNNATRERVRAYKPFFEMQLDYYETPPATVLVTKYGWDKLAPTFW